MLDPKRLETPANLEIRQSYKDQLALKAEVEPGDLVAIATEIYQSEFGHWIEDEEALDNLWKNASEIYFKHRDKTKDNSELIDLIVRDLHGDCPTVHEEPEVASSGSQLRLLN